ncbi:hypothetical protein CWC48_08850 [Pseudomonas sp. S10E 269]|nr:hypothetical protein CWC49_19010 [Pseudomonas sp. S09F 262]PJK39240.1 hypothetical protein CWC48_08850 [Pseudomonas sp. S10E 269]
MCIHVRTSFCGAGLPAMQAPRLFSCTEVMPSRASPAPTGTAPTKFCGVSGTGLQSSAGLPTHPTPTEYPPPARRR